MDDVFLVVPGSIETLTGGYGYDRRVVAELRAGGLDVAVIELPGTYPLPDAAAKAAAAARFAAIPDGARVIVDGLAFGALPELAEAEADRLRLVALVHHPLALESGVPPGRAARHRDEERRALSHARAVIATSRTTAATLVADYGVAAPAIAFPGTDPAPPAKGTGGPARLLSIGALTPRKAHRVLVEALARTRGGPWSCAIVGSHGRDPGEAAAVRDAARGLPIELPGEVADLEPWWDAADIFVLPSLHEGFGMAAAEALARGLPVVASRAGAIPEVVPPGAGVLVPPGEVQSLADTLGWLIDDPAARRTLAEGARRAGAALPRWSDAADVFRDILGRV